MTDQHVAPGITGSYGVRLGTRRPVRLARAASASILALVTLIPAVPAQAHTDLVSSDPENGSSAEKTPERIQLEFAGPISGEHSDLSLTIGTSPQRVLALDPSTGGSTVSVDIPDGRLPTVRPGSGDVAWDVAYRVISADGHPVDGNIRFRAPLPRTPVSRDSSSHPNEARAGEPSATNQREGDFRNRAILIGVGVGSFLLLPLLALVLVMGRDRRRRMSPSE